MIPHVAVCGLSLLVVFSISASIAFADGQRLHPDGPTTLPSPNPDLSPRAVVKIQVDALQKNDANDTGIKTTFRFASPANQQATGPIERFVPMVKSPAYLPLIKSRSAQVREIAVDEKTAAELAIIVDSNGDKTYYIFQLSKQSDGDCKDCWMTDGVIRVEPKDAPGEPQRKPPDGQLPA